MIAEHRRDAGRHVDEGQRHQELPDQVLHRLEGGDAPELLQEAEPKRQRDELDGLLKHRRHEEAQPVAAPARRVGQNPKPQSDRSQGQEDVDQREAQHHLDDDVEHEEAVDQVEDRQEQGHAHAPGLHRRHQGAKRRAEHVSGAVTFRETAIKPDTASATSRTRAHHQRDDAAATRPSTRRGTISRHPA